jgi:hypothetical protein
MKYTVQSWHKFKFIIAPNELREVLDGVSLKFVSDTIRDDYPQSLFEQYDDFYYQLKSGCRFAEREDLYNYYWHAALLGEADDPEAELLPFEVLELDGKWFAREDWAILPDNALAFSMNFVEPLSPNYAIKSENIIGFLLKRPKELCVYKNDEIFHAVESIAVEALNVLLDEDNNAPSYLKCDDFKRYDVYETVVSRVKKISKRLVYELEGKTYKPNVWISAGALKDAPNFYFFKSGGKSL